VDVQTENKIFGRRATNAGISMRFEELNLDEGHVNNHLFKTSFGSTNEFDFKVSTFYNNVYSLLILRLYLMVNNISHHNGQRTSSRKYLIQRVWSCVNFRGHPKESAGKEIAQ
jgi:hypothetical protein